MTRNMAKEIPLVPRVSPTSVSRVEKSSKLAQDDILLNNKMITRNTYGDQ